MLRIIHNGDDRSPGFDSDAQADLKVRLYDRHRDLITFRVGIE